MTPTFQGTKVFAIVQKSACSEKHRGTVKIINSFPLLSFCIARWFGRGRVIKWRRSRSQPWSTLSHRQQGLACRCSLCSTTSRGSYHQHQSSTFYTTDCYQGVHSGSHQWCPLRNSISQCREHCGLLPWHLKGGCRKPRSRCAQWPLQERSQICWSYIARRAFPFDYPVPITNLLTVGCSSFKPSLQLEEVSRVWSKRFLWPDPGWCLPGSRQKTGLKHGIYICETWGSKLGFLGSHKLMTCHFI